MKHTNENAVSPVIGTILMVAIVVILAAVIGAYVFDMAGGIQKTYMVGVTAKYSETGAISVMYQGGQDAPSFESATVQVIPDNGAAITYTNGGILGNSVSDIVDATSATPYVRGHNRVLVTGTFTNAQQQVLLDIII